MIFQAFYFTSPFSFEPRWGKELWEKMGVQVTIKNMYVKVKNCNSLVNNNKT